MKSFNGM